MARILLIETSGAVCSVAISDGKDILALKESPEPNSHSSVLAAFVQELKQAAGIPDAVAVSMGPGSYTGLRIGVSTAKGICFAAGIPLIAVPSLLAATHGFRRQHNISKTDAHFCPMTDARRMEVYTCLYDASDRMAEPVTASIIDEQFLSEYADQHVYYFGSGAAKCIPVFSTRGKWQYAEVQPSAADMATEASRRFENGEFENLAYFEPYYLKDFLITPPKKNR